MWSAWAWGAISLSEACQTCSAWTAWTMTWASFLALSLLCYLSPDILSHLILNAALTLLYRKLNTKCICPDLDVSAPLLLPEWRGRIRFDYICIILHICEPTNTLTQAWHQTWKCLQCSIWYSQIIHTFSIYLFAQVVFVAPNADCKRNWLELIRQTIQGKERQVVVEEQPPGLFIV